MNRGWYIIIVNKWKGVWILFDNLSPYIINLCCIASWIPSTMRHCASLPKFLNLRGTYRGTSLGGFRMINPWQVLCCVRDSLSGSSSSVQFSWASCRPRVPAYSEMNFSLSIYSNPKGCACLGPWPIGKTSLDPTGMWLPAPKNSNSKPTRGQISWLPLK